MSGALATAVATLLEHENANESRRYIDLSVSLRLCDVDPDTQRWQTETDEELIEVGGRWDRRQKRWSGDAKRQLVIRVHRGQEKAARWLAEWFRRRARGPRGPQWSDFRRVWSVLLLGGRRGGKSHLACVALVMFAAMVPRSRVFAVSPTQEETDELEQAVRSLMPRRWYRFRGGGAGKPLQFRLANGARILCLSGHKPRSLKRGRVDFALYNETQNMSKAGWVQLRGAISDRGGLCVLAANPPDAELGRWVEEVYEQAKEKKNLVEVFELSAKDNPFVEYQALADMEADINDPITFAREVEGKMMPIGDIVMHSWSVESIRTPGPELVDVTAELTRAQLGRAAGYIIGCDFQLQPAMVASVVKLFKDPADPNEVIPWVVDEAFVEDADENDLLDAIEAIDRWTPSGRVEGQTYRGWIESGDDKANPVHASCILDASAWWQDGAHSKGKTSDRAFAARRWAFLYKPQKESDRNPDILERVKCTNAKLKNANGRRRMFVAPWCEHTIRAMRSWENKNGVPNRRSKYAHLCDAVSYVVYRFFGTPRKQKGKLEYRGLGRFNRARELRGW